MSFLNKIDAMHTDCQSEYCSEELSKSFSTYISVEPVGISLTKQFMIQKQEKAKLLASVAPAVIIRSLALAPIACAIVALAA